MAEKQKVSDWLDECGSHQIFGASINDDFVEKTGEPVCWPSYSRREMQNAIIARGKGGTLNGEGPFVTASDMAAACAQKYADFASGKMGMGFAFREHVDAIRKAGH